MTAELALVLPAVVAVLVLALSTAGAAIEQVRCADAARAGARAAALGDDLAGVRAAVTALADDDAVVDVRRTGEWVVVRVSSPWRTPWGALLASAEARAWAEPTSAGRP